LAHSQAGRVASDLGPLLVRNRPLVRFSEERFSVSFRDGSVIDADWEWQGHVALWSCSFEEAGQHVAVKVNESEGGGVALPHVVDNVAVEATVRARLINLASFQALRS